MERLLVVYRFCSHGLVEPAMTHLVLDLSRKTSTSPFLTLGRSAKQNKCYYFVCCCTNDRTARLKQD